MLPRGFERLRFTLSRSKASTTAASSAECHGWPSRRGRAKQARGALNNGSALESPVAESCCNPSSLWTHGSFPMGLISSWARF